MDVVLKDYMRKELPNCQDFIGNIKVLKMGMLKYKSDTDKSLCKFCYSYAISAMVSSGYSHGYIQNYGGRTTSRLIEEEHKRPLKRVSYFL